MTDHKTTLIVARHGNTFEAGETPRRVGAKTDLSLTQKGVEQAIALGHYLETINLLPDVIYTSELKRTIETALAILHARDLDFSPRPDAAFNEIDYGPDENQTEDVVLARIGPAAMRDWDEYGILPPDWSPGADIIRQNWRKFAEHALQHHAGQTILVVTSNGIARFALDLAGDAEDTRREFGLKLATGAFGALTHTKESGWVVQNWNIRP